MQATADRGHSGESAHVGKRVCDKRVMREKPPGIATPGFFVSPFLNVGETVAAVLFRRPAGLNSPATWSSAGFVMREIQIGLHNRKVLPNSVLRKAPIIRRPFAFPTVRRSVWVLG